MSMFKRVAACFCLFATFGNAYASSADCNTRKYYECYDYEEDETEKPAWQEEKLKLPAPPDNGKLIPFEVSVANENRFFVDPGSISVGNDRVVRFTVVIQSPEGARTVNYEGLHCGARQRRVYAFGQNDGGWFENKGSTWVLMQKQEGHMRNAYAAILYDEYFCMNREPPKDAATAIERLNNGSAAISTR